MVVDGGAGYESCVRGIGGVGGLVLFVVKIFYRRGIEWFGGIDGRLGDLVWSWRFVLSIVCDKSVSLYETGYRCNGPIEKSVQIYLLHCSAGSISRAVKEIDIEFFMRRGNMLKDLKDQKGEIQILYTYCLQV